MSKVIWHVAMSVDGFIAGPDDTMDWISEREDHSAVADDVMSSVGAILGGRRWYDVATERYDGRAGIYGGAWSGPVFVLTHRPPENPEDDEITFLTTGLQDAVAETVAAAGDKDIAIFGANVAQQCLEAGLIDEIVIHVVPVLLGDGVRLNTSGGPRRELVRTHLGESGQFTDLRFAVSAR
ncbi:MAG TPA: dihydrofolate reductase family protein [Mycobacteriales bacterium]|nr:dihydrofolate reductase family protein [Mycobacteriales bacterium]